MQPLVDLINRADPATERIILENLERKDAALAEAVRAKLFVFEDITTLEDRGVQLVLRQVETGDLAVALKGVTDVVREKVLSNVSERARENLLEEIELLGPQRVSAVEEARAKVVQVIRALEESGQIILRRGATMTSSASPRQFAPLSAAGGRRRPRRAAGRACPGLRRGLVEWQPRGCGAGRGRAGRRCVQEHERAAAAAQVGRRQRDLRRSTARRHQLLQALAPTLDDAADAVLDAALALARVIVGAELTVVDASAQAALRRALRPLPTDSVVTVRLNASDVALLDDVLTRTPTR